MRSARGGGASSGISETASGCRRRPSSAVSIATIKGGVAATAAPGPFAGALAADVSVVDLDPQAGGAELVTPVSLEHGLHQLVLKSLGGSLHRRACPDILTGIAWEGERPWS